MTLVGISLIIIGIFLAYVAWKRIPEHAASEYGPNVHTKRVAQCLGIALLGGLSALIGFVFCALPPLIKALS